VRSACSQGWLAFQGSCYRMSKESKPWKRAQQACELSSQGAHLLDIGNEEEHAFILSYLQTVSQIIMLWTGLNDVKVSLFDLPLVYSNWKDGNFMLKIFNFSFKMFPFN
uniref:C-type lectin domain-containing protein n=1 Tax=Apteryx owenii TaxID=8824 RepID=A0A8B9PY62_APTOW